MKTLFLAAALLQSAPQFDLLCLGTLSTDSISGQNSEPYTYQLRVDLTANRWCEDACRVVREIAGVSSAQITLQRASTSTLREDDETTNWVNRQTGEHRMSVSSLSMTGPLTMQWRGRCEPAPFSGFPERRTRF